MEGNEDRGFLLQPQIKADKESEVCLKGLTQLKLDYDGAGWFELYRERLKTLERIFAFNIARERIYESRGGNHHVRVWIDMRLMPLEIALFQAILGSDHLREAFNLRRIRAGQKNWNILFQPRREITL